MMSIVRILVATIALFSLSETLQVASAFARGGFRLMRPHFHAPVHRPSFHHVYRPTHVAPAIHRPSHIAVPSSRPANRIVVPPKQSTQAVQRDPHSPTQSHRPTSVSQTTTRTQTSASASVPSQTTATTSETSVVPPARGDVADWRLVKPDPFPGTPTDPQVPDNIRFGR